ncbi:hypothetical protein VULLAG_LOCUS11418 [Vulpes lagopus]
MGDRRGRQTRAAPRACQGHRGAQRGLLCPRDPPPDPHSSRKQRGGKREMLVPHLSRQEVWEGDSGTPRSAPAAPRHRPRLPPEPGRTVTAAPRGGGGAANPATGDVKTPRAALDRISARGEGDGCAESPPGAFTSGGQAPEAEQTPRQAMVRARGGRDPQPRGALRARRPPPAQRPLGDVVRPRASGALRGSRRPQCPTCTAQAPQAGAGGSAVRGHPPPREGRARPALLPAGPGRGWGRGLRRKLSPVAEATHRPRGTRGSRSSRNGRLRSSPSRVCQKEAGAFAFC